MAVRCARRWAALTLVLGVVSMSSPPHAAAINPPVIEPGPPPSGPVGPREPTELKALCGIETGTLTHTDFHLPTSAEAMLDYRGAWRFSRGAGQKVAVIDTGVNRHPRLPALEGGGDYVSGGDGLQDCDAHGTLVAGIIAGSPSPDDGFAGVAPEATILSIRQNSAVFGIAGANGSQQSQPDSTSIGYGNTLTLAYAITHAVDLGATVINMSEVACSSAGADMHDTALGQAVRYAFEHNVVVVAAAGNVSTQSEQGMCPTQNTMIDPNRPLQTGWGSVSTIASPAWFQDYVLAVGAVTPLGAPADFSLHGPWLGVAAPGERITSLDPNRPGLTNAVQGRQGLAPINGTSFAAPFVSGLVALIRSRFPDLNAAQVVELVKRTAHTPGEGPNAATGYGVIDPAAALTYVLPDPATLPDPLAGVPIPGRAPVPPENRRPRVIVLSISAASVVLMGVAGALAATHRRRESPAAVEAPAGE